MFLVRINKFTFVNQQELFWPVSLEDDDFRFGYYRTLVKITHGGILIWPIQDEWMNVTKKFVHDQKDHTDKH